MYLSLFFIQNGTKEFISKLVTDLNSAKLEPDVGEIIFCTLYQIFVLQFIVVTQFGFTLFILEFYIIIFLASI